MVIGTFVKGNVILENSDEARVIIQKGSYGSTARTLSLYEAVYLAEKGKIKVVDGKGKDIPFDTLYKKAIGYDKAFVTKYAVFADMRTRGYVVKTALKYGAEFRVYDRGVKPGENHAKWVLYPVAEAKAFSWHEFCAKNRVAHSTRKTLLIGIVDEQLEVTYYEVAWKRP